MKVIRYMGADGRPRWGLLDDVTVHDVAVGSDDLPVAVLAPSVELSSLMGAASRNLTGIELLPPIEPDARIFCIAQNYADHSKEVGSSPPTRPLFFLKPHSSVVGSGAVIAIPSVTSFLDYEGELGVVIGVGGADISVADAANHIAGYTVCNDGSARDLTLAQLGAREIVDWFSVKSLDASSAVGPWIVPAGTVSDPMRLELQTVLNGDIVQSTSTSAMTHDIYQQIAFISERVALRPGDLIMTGTPGGVGKARGRELRAGDRLEVTIESIGTLALSYASPSAVT